MLKKYKSNNIMFKLLKTKHKEKNLNRAREKI